MTLISFNKVALGKCGARKNVFFFYEIKEWKSCGLMKISNIVNSYKKSFIHSFTHSFNKCLISHYVQHTVQYYMLGTHGTYT